MKLCPFPTCQRCYEDGDSSCVHEGHPALVHIRDGTRFIDGRYRLDSLIGRGAMGAVYRCTHIGLNQPRAIKLLLPDSVNSDPNRGRRLRREAITACRFDHPNVVRIHDSGTNIVSVKDDGTTQYYDELYIVMELLEGETLKDFLKRNKPLPLNQAVSIAIQIADGLAEVHTQHVIYRDLKPANIMLTHDRHGNLLVKIVDFGAVKLLDPFPENDDDDLTGAMFIGSASYASPENCKNEPLDERSDIYNLGLILYEMLAGHSPFKSSSWVELLNKQAYDTPRLLINVPKPLALLIAKSLEKDPNERPQSAAEFARILRDFESSVEASSKPIPKAPTVSVSSVTTKSNSHSRRLEEESTNDEETRVAVVVSTRGKEVRKVSKSVKEATPSKQKTNSSLQRQEGTVVQGTILHLSADGAVVNLGSRPEGLITWDELGGNAEGKMVATLKPGQKINATIKKVKGAGGFTYLSRPIVLVAQSTLAANSQGKKISKPDPVPVKVDDQTKANLGTTIRTIVGITFISVSLAASIVLIWRLGHNSLPVTETVETSNSITSPEAPKFSSNVGDELITTTDVNIRIRPGGKSKWIGLAEAGSLVRVLEKQNNWRKIIVLQHGRIKEDPESADEGWIDGDNLTAKDSRN